MKTYRPIAGLITWIVFLLTLQAPAQVKPIESGTAGHRESARLIEVLTEFKSDQSSMIIDVLRTELSKQEDSRGYIIVYCGKICHYGEIEAHLRGIESALRRKSVDNKDFSIISGGYKDKATTEFWVVPKNTCVPMGESTLPFKDIRYKGKFKKHIVEYECC